MTASLSAELCVIGLGLSSVQILEEEKFRESIRRSIAG